MTRGQLWPLLLVFRLGLLHDCAAFDNPSSSSGARAFGLGTMWQVQDLTVHSSAQLTYSQFTLALGACLFSHNPSLLAWGFTQPPRLPCKWKSTCTHWLTPLPTPFPVQVQVQVHGDPSFYNMSELLLSFTFRAKCYR